MAGISLEVVSSKRPDLSVKDEPKPRVCRGLLPPRESYYDTEVRRMTWCSEGIQYPFLESFVHPPGLCKWLVMFILYHFLPRTVSGFHYQVALPGFAALMLRLRDVVTHKSPQAHWFIQEHQCISDADEPGFGQKKAFVLFPRVCPW